VNLGFLQPAKQCEGSSAVMATCDVCEHQGIRDVVEELEGMGPTSKDGVVI
jgi:hypothetical protein